MITILEETSIFIRLGPVDTYDHSVSIETKFPKNLIKYIKSGYLSSTISDLIRPVSSIRSRFYGLPKTHKEGVLLRPILSMICSSENKVAKWFTTILQLMLDYCSVFHFSCIVKVYPLISVVYIPAFPFLRLLIYVQIYNIEAICPLPAKFLRIHCNNKICYHICRI